MRALGNCVNVQQKVALDHSLKILSHQSGSPVTFWGVIQGLSKNYFIAKGVKLGEAVENTYYVSTDCMAFSKLPETDDWVARKSNLISASFQGNANHLYKDPEKQPKYNEDGEIEEDDEEEEEEPEEDDEDGAPKKPKERKLSEIERVSYTVQAIDFDCAVVPKGMYYLTPTGVISRNKNFSGLSRSDATKLESYALLRDPVSPSSLTAIRKGGVANITDCFDSIVDGKPQNLWACVQRSDSVSLRSLEWLGYEFNGTDGHYFGLGIKNRDVVFMI